MLEEKDMDEIVQVCLASFVGNKDAPGEDTFKWTFGPENREDPPDSCERFKKGMEFYMYWCARSTMWYGSVLGWRDQETGKLLGCCLTFHPGSITYPGRPITNWRFLQMVLNMRRGPPDHEDEKTYGKWAKLRHKQMGQAMEDLHKSVPGKHWYVYVLAAQPDQQGKGIGSKLLAAVKDMAKLEEDPLTPVYLECSPGKQGYYEKQGFTSVKTKKLEDPNPEGEGPYEAHAMLCVPKLLPDATKPEPAAAQEGAAGLYPKVQK